MLACRALVGVICRENFVSQTSYVAVVSLRAVRALGLLLETPSTGESTSVALGTTADTFSTPLADLASIAKVSSLLEGSHSVGLGQAVVACMAVIDWV